MTTGPAVEVAGPPWTLNVPVVEITLHAEPVVEVGWPPPEPVVEVRWPPPGWRLDPDGVWRPEPDEPDPAAEAG